MDQSFCKMTRRYDPADVTKFALANKFALAVRASSIASALGAFYVRRELIWKNQQDAGPDSPPGVGRCAAARERERERERESLRAPRAHLEEPAGRGARLTARGGQVRRSSRERERESTCAASSSGRTSRTRGPTHRPGWAGAPQLALHLDLSPTRAPSPRRRHIIPHPSKRMCVLAAPADERASGGGNLTLPLP
jgi:hypothetical protein